MLPPGESHWVCTKVQTDGRQTIALCISLHTASVVMPVKQKLKIVVCKCISSRVVSFSKAKLRGKGFSYLLPSVGPGADPAVQAVSPQVTISHPPGGRLPLLFARHVVTFPATEHHHLLAGTSYTGWWVTEAHMCQQLAKGCYAAFARSRIWTHDLLIASPTLYPLRHLAKAKLMSVTVTMKELVLKVAVIVGHCLIISSKTIL